MGTACPGPVTMGGPYTPGYVSRKQKGRGYSPTPTREVFTSAIAVVNKKGRSALWTLTTGPAPLRSLHSAKEKGRGGLNPGL